MKEISEEDKKRLFGYLQQHLVCFGFCYAHEPNAEGQSESFVAVSGFIIEFNDKWWLVTAGHIHTEFESLHKEKKITRRALFDGFSPNAVDDHPIPFDLFDNDTIRIYSEKHKVDFSLTVLDPNTQKLLAKNDVIPLKANWNRKEIDEFDSFGIAGFPAEYTKNSSTLSSTGGEVMPVYVPLEFLKVTDKQDELPRFSFRIKQMNQNSIKGMSGGPLFGFKQVGSDAECELVGIQSTWVESKMKTYATPLYIIKELIECEFNKGKEV